MDGGLSIYYYIATAAAVGGTIVTTLDEIESNKARQKILEQEIRTNELKALDAENQRLEQLRFADDDILANAGGIDAYASASLIAGRQFNFKIGMEDILNIRFNQLNSDAALSARISILRGNRRAAQTSGILQAFAQIAGGIDEGSRIFGGGEKKTETVFSKKSTKKTAHDLDAL